MLLRYAMPRRLLQKALIIHGKKPGNPAACGGGEWTGEPSIWLRQTAVGFFLGISPGRIGGTSLRKKLKSFPNEAPGLAPGRFTCRTGLPQFFVDGKTSRDSW